jgi:hypothetical protein
MTIGVHMPLPYQLRFEFGRGQAQRQTKYLLTTDQEADEVKGSRIDEHGLSG